MRGVIARKSAMVAGPRFSETVRDEAAQTRILRSRGARSVVGLDSVEAIPRFDLAGIADFLPAGAVRADHGRLVERGASTRPDSNLLATGDRWGCRIVAVQAQGRDDRGDNRICGVDFLRGGGRRLRHVEPSQAVRIVANAQYCRLKSSISNGHQK